MFLFGMVAHAEHSDHSSSNLKLKKTSIYTYLIGKSNNPHYWLDNRNENKYIK